MIVIKNWIRPERVQEILGMDFQKAAHALGNIIGTDTIEYGAVNIENFQSEFEKLLKQVQQKHPEITSEVLWNGRSMIEEAAYIQAQYKTDRSKCITALEAQPRGLG